MSDETYQAIMLAFIATLLVFGLSYGCTLEHQETMKKIEMGCVKP